MKQLNIENYLVFASCFLYLIKFITMITKYFTTKHVFLAIFAILLLSIAFQFFSLLSFPDSSIVLVKGDTVKLQPEDSLTQKFTANRDGLNKVEFLLRTPGIVFENKDVMKVQLLDENCQKPLREGVLKESFLNSGNLYEFPFSKVENSQNKIFCVIANFPSALFMLMTMSGKTSAN